MSRFVYFLAKDQLAGDVVEVKFVAVISVYYLVPDLVIRRLGVGVCGLAKLFLE